MGLTNESGIHSQVSEISLSLMQNSNLSVRCKSGLQTIAVYLIAINQSKSIFNRFHNKRVSFYCLHWHESCKLGVDMLMLHHHVYNISQSDLMGGQNSHLLFRKFILKLNT